MKFDKSCMLVYAVTDRSWLGTHTLVHDVEESMKGGATMIQLREKELDDKEFLAEAIEIKALCKKYNVPLIINDNVDIAVLCDADGIHIGQSDMNVLKVRERLGNDKIIGVSVQTVEQARVAVNSGADYLGVGSVFTTSTKKDADFVSYVVLKDICNTVSVPVCAIGGIYDYNIKELTGSGIDGVAVVSALFAQPDIKAASEKILRLSMGIVTL